MQAIYFIRGDGEYREVWVYEDGKYRIKAQTGFIGKEHENFSDYYNQITQNGWVKCTLHEYLRQRYK